MGYDGEHAQRRVVRQRRGHRRRQVALLAALVQQELDGVDVGRRELGGKLQSGLELLGAI